MNKRILTAAAAATAFALAPQAAWTNEARQAAMPNQNEAASQGQSQNVDVVRLEDWDYTGLYEDGWSVSRFLDAEVYGETGEEIGEIENLLIDTDGNVIAMIAEVGGFWDIGDTHVAIPWDQVTVTGQNQVAIPLTEENVENYSIFQQDYISAPDADRIQQVDDDVQAGARIWKASELMGDYVMLNDQQGYGYVTDFIVGRDGSLQSIVVSPSAGYGRGGSYAYPWYGNRGGWNPNEPYYNMPYGRDEVMGMERFDYDRLSDDIMGRDAG